MAPKRKAGAKATPQPTRAKSAAAASSDTVGIPELFKKVKADLQPDSKLAPQTQEKAALEPASVAQSAADCAGGSDDAASAAAAARAPTVPPAAAAAPPQVPLTAAEDELLRDFDLDIAFGPSLGLTRKVTPQLLGVLLDVFFISLPLQVRLMLGFELGFRPNPGEIPGE